MKILHVLRNADDPKALECIGAQAKENNTTLLLVQDGVDAVTPADMRTYILLL